MKSAIVVLVVGEKYIQEYNLTFRASHERFSKKINIPLVVIQRYIDASAEGLRHPAWQKLLIFEAIETKDYDILCWIDADIYITPHAKNPFDYSKDDHWVMVKNDLRGMEYYLEGDLKKLQFCPEVNRPGYLYNTGFFIVSRKQHSVILKQVYENYNLQYFNFSNSFEQAPLSYHLFNKQPGKELGFQFNAQVLSHLTRKGYSFWNFYKFYKKNYFIHFVGGTGDFWLEKVLMIENVQLNKIVEHLVFEIKTSVVNFIKKSNNYIKRRLV